MTRQAIYGKYKISGHILFWLASVIAFSFILAFNEEQWTLELILKSLATNTGFFIGVYGNLYFLIPKLLKQKSYIFYVFGLVVLLTLCSLFIQALFIYPLHGPLSLGDTFTSFNTNLHSAYFFATLAYVIATSLLKFMKDWIDLQGINLKMAKMEQQKLEAELKTLKGQLNPHFLFNSLNNIYSLSLMKSEKVPDLILKLSDLMRHIIYDSRENYIPLRKEIEFVENFISLQKIRTTDNTQIRYNIKGEIPPGKIAPLLFEPFIDNAFKHGLPGSVDSDHISIHFDFSRTGYVVFQITNNFHHHEGKHKKASGIGLENVKQRLKHLYGPGEYDLKIETKDQLFSVILDLKLK